ncbi:putative phosphorylated adapter RNA export protein [Apostichopus japonicus]|uniref:Phosphorylated adapter RNA export protein n=1 Tax=Stichopus japonicus TaxID=307972 RepID=A0A2G8LA98_STIJA|nr:putative phosphorylated adapter RNA export protein [Apostichopus japonicus]
MSSVASYRSQPAQVFDSESSDSDEEDQPWKRQKKKKEETPMVVSSAARERDLPARSTSGRFKRKRNNIWAEVVQEQEEEQVARDITQFDMYSSKERDVESYNFKINDEGAVKHQPLGNPIVFDDKADNKNRKVPDALGSSHDDAWLEQGEGNQRGVKARLGSTGDYTGETKGVEKYSNSMKHVKLRSDMHKKDLAGKIAYSLQEPKREMVKTVVDELGVEKVMSVWEETWDLEQHGGMMVNNGSRRRTPGGVFFQLLKTDPDIPKEKKDIIFAMSNFQSKQEGKSRRRRLRRKHRTNAMDTNQTDGGRDESKSENNAEVGKKYGDDKHWRGGEIEDDGIKGEEEEETEDKDNTLTDKVDRTVGGEVKVDRNVGKDSDNRENAGIVKTDIQVEPDEMEEGEISD